MYGCRNEASPVWPSGSMPGSGHATTGHVSSDGDRTKRARSGNDLAFLGVLAGVEHIMRHTCFEHGAEPFGIFRPQIQNTQHDRQVIRVLWIDAAQLSNE